MKMNFSMLVAACLLLLSATCKKNNAVVDYTVPVTSCVSITNVPNARQVCLDSIVMDSRCRPGAACISEGEVVCRFEVRTASGAQMVTLGMSASGNTIPVYPREADVYNLHIRLDGVQPYADAGTYNQCKAMVNITPR